MEIKNNFEITDKLISEIAHKLSGIVISQCCYKTGGHGGPNAHPSCDCIDTAKDILEYLQKYKSGD